MFIALGIAVFLFLVLLILDYPPLLVAGGWAMLIILTGTIMPRATLEKLDCVLFFFGLFIIAVGVERAGWTAFDLEYFWKIFHGGRLGLLSWLEGFFTLLSNLINNVRAAILLTKLSPDLGDSGLYWLALAKSSTLAGNLTVMGSMANIIASEQCRQEARISFGEDFCCGLSITLILGMALPALFYR